MKKNISFSDEYAVSELVGGLMLILIALVAFSVIYMYVFPLPIEPAASNVKLMGYVNDEGFAVIEHMGGEALSSYKIDVRHTNGTLIGTTSYREIEDSWEIGESIYPLIGMYLLTEEDKVWVTVYSIHDDSSEEAIFDGILIGKGSVVPPIPPPETPMLISSLRTNTIDEDLICYNDTITPAINALTYIYNWSVNGSPILSLLLPFDTNSSDTAKDYSGNGNDGTVVGPIWDGNGIVGGAYQFDGVDDYISLPDSSVANFIDEITVEAWINTSASSGTIASFERDVYWELAMNSGNIVWSTTVGVDTADTTGGLSVNDDSWHHIAVTYDSSFGENRIYVDGTVDITEAVHNPGDELGSGDPPLGSIGLGSEAVEETIFSTSFETAEEENKWSKDEDRTTDWLDRGVFERLASDSLNPRTGSYSIGGSGDMTYWWNRYHAAYNREAIDLSGYTGAKVSVYYSYKDTEGDDEFGLYYQDGAAWIPIFEEFNPAIGDGQSPWSYVEADIPDDIDNLVLQFWWSTSASREYVTIDDLEITGLPSVGSGNFSGFIDEFRIYNRALSGEQIYQNYLCSKDGFSDKSVIVSEETSLSNVWKCTVTPNDGDQDDTAVESNSLQIISYSGGEG